MNYKQTKHFPEFHCIGGKCMNNCCHSWNVMWSSEKVKKLRSAPDCSDKLRSLIDSVFEQLNDKYYIKLRDDGNCPFQLEDGLCIIQKELDESYLSDICNFFPRSYFSAGNTVFCSLSLSCPVVFQSLLDNENAAVLLTARNTPYIRDKISSAGDSLPPELLEKHTEVKYHKQLIEFFYEIIADKRFSAEDNLVRGALAAEKLTEAVARGGGKKISGMISELRGALCDGGVIEVIKSVEPEYEAQVKLIEAYTEPYFGSCLADIFRDGSGKADAEKIRLANERLNSELADRPFWYRNILLNLLLELIVPFRSMQKNISENYAEYAAAAVLIKLCAAASMATDELLIDMSEEKGQKFEFRGKERISGMCTFVLRVVNQNRSASKMFSEKFNSGKLTPRDIAMLIK